jgi:septum formation protein
MRIVLASASPRRQELLRNAAIDFVVCPANIEEVQLQDEPATTFAERMARDKARAVRQSTTDGWILAADTIVVVEEEVLGKPRDQQDAARMLRLLSGREHQVITGVSLIGNGFEDVRSETTTVHFSTMSDVDIREYIASGEPMDKAGAYAIQGIASRWITRIEGDYSNVVGLPVDLVWQILREHSAWLGTSQTQID